MSPSPHTRVKCFTCVEIATQQFPSVPCEKNVISSKSDPLGGGETYEGGAGYVTGGVQCKQ